VTGTVDAAGPGAEDCGRWSTLRSYPCALDEMDQRLTMGRTVVSA
jgi:hypothetical protein